MSLAMTPRERVDFLTEVHVAVVSVADENGRGPLSVPLWYEYEPGGELSIVTDRDSRKTALIRAAGRISVCVQTHTVPYRYVSAEGPVTGIEPVTHEERRTLARRYLGVADGDKYVDSTREITERMVRIRVHPEHWLSQDYTKLS
jgi:PPOX class probable F420-dependent enzyme